jgi:outer membrane lipoprotein-sorting protein
MHDRPPTIALLLVGCLLALFAGGVGTLPGDEEPDERVDPEQRVTEMLAGNPESVEGHLEEVVERNDTVLERQEIDVISEPPDGQRRVRFVRDEEGNLTIVQNPSTAWTYEEDENEVTRYDLEGSEDGLIIPAIEYDHYEMLVEEFEVDYAGTDRVAGHEADVIVFRDPSEEPTTASLDVVVGDEQYSLVETTLTEPLVFGEHRLWIHAEHDYPLKEQTTLVGQDGTTMNFTTRYDHVEFGTDHDEDTFTFDPPEDAVQRDPPEMSSENFESVEAAQAVAPYPVPEPTVPARFELDRILVAEVNDTTRVQLFYADGNETVRVRVLPGFDHELRGMSVSVDGHPGTVTRGYAKTTLYWTCADRTYAVIGPVSTEEKLSIAESIECASADSQGSGES